jgi:hypothetical protein
MDFVSIFRLITIVLGGLAIGAAGGHALRSWRYRRTHPAWGTIIGAIGSMIGVVALELVLLKRIGENHLTYLTPFSVICFSLVIVGRVLTAQGK